MKKVTYIGLLGASTLVCLSFFQNCSKIATADLASSAASGKVSGSGDPITTSPVQTTVDDTGIRTQAGNLGRTTIATPKAPHTDSDTGETTVVAPAPKKNETCRPDDKACIKKNQEEVAARVACLNASASGSRNHGSIQHGGAVVLSVTGKLSSVHHLKSLVAAAAPGQTDASIGEIQHIDDGNGGGDVLLCGLTVNGIQHVRGNVTLVNCTVNGSIEHFGGNLTEIND